MPKDRVTNLHQGYGFVEFRSEEDADYVSIINHEIAFLIHCDVLKSFVIIFLWLDGSCQLICDGISFLTGNQNSKHDQALWKANTGEQGVSYIST